MGMEIDFRKGDGLIPVIVQDASTNEVLMMAYMNQEAWKETLRTKKACFWSRSRRKLWLKGETSGHFQEVKEMFLDCDGDTLLLKVDQKGGQPVTPVFGAASIRDMRKGRGKFPERRFLIRRRYTGREDAEDRNSERAVWRTPPSSSSKSRAGRST